MNRRCPECGTTYDHAPGARTLCPDCTRMANAEHSLKYGAEWRKLARETRERWPWCWVCGAGKTSLAGDVSKSGATDLALMTKRVADDGSLRDGVYVSCKSCTERRRHGAALVLAFAPSERSS